ncbi:MAG: glycoside hydrolase family 27 protein [Limisphaerales bacterium]
MISNSIRFLIFVCLVLAPARSPGQEKSTTPAYWGWAAVPPLGWNSYDAFGDSVTEQEVVSNADYMQQHLLAHGWKYVVVDFRWYDAVATYNDNELTRTRMGARLAADPFGRLLPAVNRFPSATNGVGFKPLADKIHAMGLKFGFHMMRGIPRQAVLAKTPIEGSPYTAADAANTNSTCGWCPDMYGVRANAAGQAWYDSCARLWASWGLDFVKIDDFSNPYHTPEIEMVRKALDQCGRAFVLSTSAGPTPISQADHVKTHANMWRISGDFWDQWSKLNHQFDLLAQWQGVGGPGHWPDADMIPFGHIGIRDWTNAKERWTRFTKDEQRTLMSLWALAPSPMMLGMNLPDNDAWTLSLLTNDEVLAIDQDPMGSPARRVARNEDGTEIWVKELQDGSKAIGLFNRSQATADVALNWNEAGLVGKEKLRDLWNQRDLGNFDQTFSVPVPAHGSVLLRAAPAD